MDVWPWPPVYQNTLKSSKLGTSKQYYFRTVSCDGFQLQSKITTRFAATRFVPREPARVEISIRRALNIKLFNCQKGILDYWHIRLGIMIRFLKLL